MVSAGRLKAGKGIAFPVSVLARALGDPDLLKRNDPASAAPFRVPLRGPAQ